MTVLRAIGLILRVILRIALLPIQALLTILLFAFGFASGIFMIGFVLLGAFLCIGGVLYLIMNPNEIVCSVEMLVVGSLFFAVPMAISTWGTEIIVMVKKLLARI